jgi:tetratricopeptide (TPR) repeat protein
VNYRKRCAPPGDEAAIECYERVLSQTERQEVNALRRMGYCLSRLGRLEEALEVWNELGENHPDAYDALFAIGTELHMMGDNFGALRCLDAYLQRDDSNGSAWNIMGTVLLFLERYEEAVRAQVSP